MVDTLALMRPSGYVQQPWSVPAKPLSRPVHIVVPAPVLREAFTGATPTTVGVVARLTVAELERDNASLRRELERTRQQLATARRGVGRAMARTPSPTQQPPAPRATTVAAAPTPSPQ